MCLIANHEHPLVASKDIQIYKHVREIYSQDNKKYGMSPCQYTRFELDKEFIAKPNRVALSERSNGTFKINGGVIHACLWPDFGRGKCLKAYIPKGTEYWIGVDRSTVCAKKIVVTSTEVKPEDFAGLDPEIAECVYNEAHSNSDGIKIGDFLTNDDGYITPIQAGKVTSLKGMVVGFKENGEPLVADVFRIIKDISVDTAWNSTLNKHISNTAEARKEFDGYANTQAWKEAWKESCKYEPNRFKAIHEVIKLGEEYYIPALGEMETLLTNVIYLAASLTLAGRNCPFVMTGWFWTSTERSLFYCWFCHLRSYGVFRDWYFKYGQYRVVPFIASAKGERKIVKKKKRNN